VRGAERPLEHGERRPSLRRRRAPRPRPVRPACRLPFRLPFRLPRGRAAGHAAAEPSRLEPLEDAAAVVVDHDHAQVGPRLPGPDREPGRVVEQGQVPDEREGDRAGMVRRVGERRAGGGGEGPVDPARAPAGHHPRVRLRRQRQIDIPHRQRVTAPQQRFPGQRGDNFAGNFRLREVTAAPGVKHGRRRRGRGRVGAAPLRQPRAGRRLAVRRSVRCPGQPYRRRHVGRRSLRVGPQPGALRDHDMPDRRCRAGVAGPPRAR
jgi:hypothetical protein